MLANVVALKADIAVNENSAVKASAIEISAIMVSYMTGPALFESIAAVMNDPDIFELILIDNGNDIETRRTLKELEKKHKNLVIVKGHGNIGFSKANNLGVTFAQKDYLLFVNPDAVLRSKTARKLAECGENLKQPWITGGMLRFSSGQEQRGARREALTPWTAVKSFTPLHKLPFMSSIHLEKKPVPKQSSAMPVVSGACMMMCQTSFDMLGGFDEDFFLHVEDIDLCRRATEAGGEVYFVPDANVIHYGSTSSVRRGKVEWEKSKGFITYFRKHAKTRFGRFLVTLASPLIILAIMGRAWCIGLRQALIGR